MATFSTVDAATAAIQAHPVCAQFQLTPLNAVVFFPPTYRMPGGISVPRGLDDLTALNALYDRIDGFWNAQRLKVSK